MSLTGKVAVVTGGSRGIGRAIALALAGQGARVAFCHHADPAAEATLAEIRALSDGIAVDADVSDEAQVKALFDAAIGRFGAVDILVNNAATNPFFGELAAIDESAWQKTVDVNLKGPFFMIQKAIPLMKAAGKGSVVNVSSVNGIRPATFQGVYSITKGALITMTQAFAKELASHNIRVNALLPGFTDTQFSSVLMQNKEIYQTVVAQIPLKRHAEPDEMVGAVLYLVSDAASYTTGTCITCDGGLLS